MYKYLEILNVSIFLTSLYLVFSNLLGNKYKKAIMRSIILIIIISLKITFILKYDSYDKFIFFRNISDLMVLLLLIDIDVSNANKKTKQIILSINYILALGLLLLALDSKYVLYSTIIETYILMSSLYLFYTYLSRTKFNIKYVFYFIYFGQIFINLILENNILFVNVNLILESIFSIYILTKLFKEYIKNTYNKNLDITSRINRSNINMKIHSEKLNTKKNTNNDINEIINKKENLLNLMLKGLDKCMFLIDNEGYIINGESSFYEMWQEYADYKYNVSLDEFCKNSIEDYNKFLNNIEKSKKIFECIDDEILDRKGRIINCRYLPVKLNNNDIGIICIMTDITSRKNIEVRIKDNNTKYKKIVDSMPYSILVTNKEDIIYDNKKNEYIDFNKEDIKDIILGKYPKGELYYTYDNGIDVCLNIDKIDYREGEEDRSLVIIKDITNFKNLLKNLEYSKEKYESLVNTIPEGIYVLNFEDKNLQYANEAFLSMVGTNDIHSIDIDNINKNIIVTSGNINDNVKYKRDILLNKYGEEINIEYGGMLLNINKKIKMIGIIRDITEQVKTDLIEREIKEKEKLNQSKNEFFINMSHELKTPLNLIHSSNQLIEVVYKNDLEITNNIDLLNTVEVVKKHVNILMGLVDNIIDLAKLQSNFHEVKRDYYNIVDISEDIVTEFSNCTNEVKIVFDTDEEEKIVNIDPDDIEKVILILLSIVVRYSIKNSNIYFDLGSKNNFITMTIKNIGGYNYEKYINDNERKVLDVGVTLAKLLVELYEGKLKIKTSNANNIEITVEIKTDYNIKIYKKRTKNKQEDFISSEYRKMCSF